MSAHHVTRGRKETLAIKFNLRREGQDRRRTSTYFNQVMTLQKRLGRAKSGVVGGALDVLTEIGSV